MNSEWKTMHDEKRTHVDPPSSFTLQHSEWSPRYSWRLLRAGPILLDGGGMFGVIPRALWSRALPPDDLGRVTLGHNCLLLHRIGQEGDGPRRVLIETGSGDKFGPKSRQIWGLTDDTVQHAVERAGLADIDIDAVIVSHLHFDHAGGLTRRARPGETPDWTGPSECESGVKLTFPSASVHVQRREWEDACVNRSVMTRTYLKENLEPIRDRLRLIDSPPPFPQGYIPERNELPASLASSRFTPIVPGIQGFLVPGHTWGQQAIVFTDDRNRTVVFTPDVLPTIHHVGSAYNLAYDVEPYTSTVTRHWFLEEAVKNDWLLVLDHEPGDPCQRVRPDGKEWYRLVPEEGVA
jgi:glyoxylase-like metal-dependent hydrolase (beta-lactamase superfamily II)